MLQENFIYLIDCKGQAVLDLCQPSLPKL